MSKFFATIFSVVLAFNLCAQTGTYNFLPTWKVGDKKTVDVVVTQSSVGKQEADTVRSESSYTIEILSETKEHYRIKIVKENVALSSVALFYEKMGDELNDYKDLELIYQVNKKTAEKELMNWKEVQKFMKKSFSAIHELIKKKVPEMEGMANLIFLPIEKTFDSKENIEAYMEDDIIYFFFPYNKSFKVGDTLTTVSKCANPFSPSDTVSQTTFSHLENINELSKTCEVVMYDELDLGEFKNMIQTMMQGMAKSFGASDSSQEEVSKGLSEIEMGMDFATTISFNYGTSWPTKVLKVGHLLMTAPEKREEKYFVTTVTFK